MPFRIGPWEIGLILVVFLICLSIYLLLTIIAVARAKKNKPRIVILDILAGWSVVGWIIALVWALSGDGSASSSGNSLPQALPSESQTTEPERHSP